MHPLTSPSPQPLLGRRRHRPHLQMRMPRPGEVTFPGRGQAISRGEKTRLHKPAALVTLLLKAEQGNQKPPEGCSAPNVSPGAGRTFDSQTSWLAFPRLPPHPAGPEPAASQRSHPGDCTAAHPQSRLKKIINYVSATELESPGSTRPPCLKGQMHGVS